jgi:hypothetical protein
MNRFQTAALALACVAQFASAQAVRSTDEAYPLAPRVIDLPVVPAAQPAVPVPVRETVGEWNVERTDGSLARSLRRWGEQAQYPVLWEADKDLPAVRAAYRGTFIAALEQLMRDTQNSAYPLHACAYDNVVRVINTSVACTR